MENPPFANHLQLQKLEESTISNQPSLFTKSIWNDTFQRIGSKFKMNLFLMQIQHPFRQPTIKLFSTRLTSMMLEGLQKLWRWRRLSAKTNNVPQISAFNICKQNIHQHNLVLISTVDFTSKIFVAELFGVLGSISSFFSWDLYWTNDMVHLHGSPPKGTGKVCRTQKCRSSKNPFMLTARYNCS